MKLNHIYSLMTSALLLFGACTPDDHDFGGAQYSSENLVAPNAYTVTIDGNKVVQHQAGTVYLQIHLGTFGPSGMS